MPIHSCKTISIHIPKKWDRGKQIRMFGNQTRRFDKLHFRDVFFTGCFIFVKRIFRVLDGSGKRDSQETQCLVLKPGFCSGWAQNQVFNLIQLWTTILMYEVIPCTTTFPQKTNGAEPTVRMWRTYPVCSQLEGGRYGDTGGPMTSLVFC